MHFLEIFSRVNLEKSGQAQCSQFGRLNKNGALLTVAEPLVTVHTLATVECKQDIIYNKQSQRMPSSSPYASLCPLSAHNGVSYVDILCV